MGSSPVLHAPVIEHLELDTYQAFAVSTDRSDYTGERRLRFHLLGLFGEVGSLLSELKKKQRDRNSYLAYQHSTLEETGDVLWYLANVADALDVKLSLLAAGLDAPQPLYGRTAAVLHFRDLQGQQSLFESPASGDYVERSLLRVASRVGRLVRRASDTSEIEIRDMRADLAQLFGALVAAASDAHISLELAANSNVTKVLGRWPLDRKYTPLFDERADADEQLPRRLQVTFREKSVLGVNYVFQSVGGINIGDRLTDNSADEDDYRFHDVFHLAFAAVLGWSPVLRALLKLKRKSNRELDEQQDGARAIITEEGISNWVFSHGLRHAAFAEVTMLDFDLLRTIRHMVRGYEVEICPMWMWEDAILQGFAMFRYLKLHRCGTLVADLEARTLTVLGSPT
jgi:NTP pyrophosphatase (non-canonical NTP hydrolase)